MGYRSKRRIHKWLSLWRGEWIKMEVGCLIGKWKAGQEIVKETEGDK